MTSSRLQAEISKPGANHAGVARRVAGQPRLIPEILNGLEADQARTKYGCLKVLRLLSEQRPELLYPHFDRFAGLLDSNNNILKWGGIIIIGNLAAMDSGNQIDRLLERYLQPISGPALITAANTIVGAGKVATAKPHLAERILRALLQVENATYQTPECRNVAIGHVLNSLALLIDQVCDHREVLDFVRRQTRNRRNAVKTRAAKLLRKLEKSAPGKPVSS